MSTSRFARLSLIARMGLLSVPLIAGLAGCAGEGGSYWSDDRYVFASRSWQPKTVTLIDTRTGESLWSVDVPVGKELHVGFSQGTGPNEYKPDEVVWEMWEDGRRFGSKDNRMPCPGRDVRRLDMTLRSRPEMPGTPVPGSPFTRNNERATTSTPAPLGYTPPVRGPYIDSKSNVTPPPPPAEEPAPLTEPEPIPAPDPVPAPAPEPPPSDMLPPR